MAPRTRKRAEPAIPAVTPEVAAAATFEPTDSIRPWPGNPRWNEKAIGPVSDSIARFGFASPIVCRLADRTVIAGHTRLEAAKRLGLSVVPVRFVDLPQHEAEALSVADNKLGEIAEWNQEALAAVLGELNAAGTEIRSLGFDDEELDALLKLSLGPAPGDGEQGPSDDEKRAGARRKLEERFGLGPFSVLDARKGWWIERKRTWIALGIRSEIGRGEDLLALASAKRLQEGTYERQSAESAAKKRSPGRSNGQDLITRTNIPAEHTVGGKRAGSYSRSKSGQSFGQDMISRKGKPAEHSVDRAKHSGGVTYQSMTAADPHFYQKKRAAEAKVGRELSLDEFRTEHYVPPKPGEESASGTSIFDPVLCELLIRWFSRPGSLVLDPFAGGSVRGVVACSLGRKYHGIELRAEQVAANREQATAIFPEKARRPTWHVGDSAKAKLPSGVEFVLTCPPYGDLEVYSDDPADISAMKWEEFCAAYRTILLRTFAALAEDRFAAVVIGDFRDPRGGYRGFPELTVAIAAEAGLAKYNDAILVTSLGSLPVRVGLCFGGGRKLGKTHQNVLVFVKGDWRKAHAALGSVEGEFGEIGAGEPGAEGEEPPAE